MWEVQEDLATRRNCAHDDDIHAMLWTKTSHGMSSRNFITGSKDNTVRVWNLNHASHKIEFRAQIREKRLSYDSWITALTPICTNHHFLYGTRDGMLGLIDEEQDVGTFSLPKPKVKAKCKTKNQDRVTTLYSLQEYDRDLDSFVWIGKPKSIICAQIEIGNNFDQIDTKSEHKAYNPNSFNILYEENVHSNDWVYCIYPIINSPSNESIYTCVVTGSSLHVYSLPSPSSILHRQTEGNNDGFKQVHSRSSSNKMDSKVKLVRTIWQEDRSTVATGNNRALIAHLEGLKKTNPLWISAACFDSSIRIFDVERNTLVQTFQLGKNLRYWQCQEYEANILLSCADDGYLRMWDTRIHGNSANVCSSPKHIGRVSSFLINADYHSVISASCHSNINHQKFQGACFRVFDIRFQENDSKPSNIDDDFSEIFDKSLKFSK